MLEMQLSVVKIRRSGFRYVW